MRSRPALASEREIREAIDVIYHGSHAQEKRIRHLVDGLAGSEEPDAKADASAEQVDAPDIDGELGADKAPVVQFVDLMLSQAVKSRASDIHIEPQEHSMMIRMRIDGMLREMVPPPAHMRSAVIARVKILSGMDIAERRLPQDGRLKIKAPRRDIDVRVSVLPTIYGEKIVMRLLDREAASHDLDKLGFEPKLLRDFKNAISKPHGIIIVTGPDRQRQEHDPLRGAELPQEPARQHHHGGGPGRVPARRHQPDPGPRRHRADVRQLPAIDPAAGPGHHPDRRNSRPRDDGNRGPRRSDRPPGPDNAAHERCPEHDQPAGLYGPGPLSAGLHAQPRHGPAAAAKALRPLQGADRAVPNVVRRLGISPSDLANATVFDAKGCSACGGTGYKGRLPIFEFLPVDDEIKETIAQSATEGQIRTTARARGYDGLVESATRRLCRGLTTLDEVVRAAFVKDDEDESGSTEGPHDETEVLTEEPCEPTA